MWRMTLKQRRRHGELMTLLQKMKKDPYLLIPKNYQVDENPEEDGKYKAVQEKFQALVEELHQLELDAEERN
jgi:hypothetical protein